MPACADDDAGGHGVSVVTRGMIDPFGDAECSTHRLSADRRQGNGVFGPILAGHVCASSSMAASRTKSSSSAPVRLTGMTFAHSRRDPAEAELRPRGHVPLRISPPGRSSGLRQRIARICTGRSGLGRSESMATAFGPHTEPPHSKRIRHIESSRASAIARGNQPGRPDKSGVPAWGRSSEKGRLTPLLPRGQRLW